MTQMLSIKKRMVISIMWNKIEKIMVALQKCNQNTPSNQVLNLVNEIFVIKNIQKVYFEHGFFVKELSVPVKSHELKLAQMLVGNSLTHEVLPLWFRDGYAFEPSTKVIEFLKENSI